MRVWASNSDQVLISISTFLNELIVCICSGSNTNQSHKSEEASESNEVKVGAFATKKMSSEKPSGDNDDDFLDLFNLERSSSKEEPTPPPSASKLTHISKPAVSEKSEAKKALLFGGEPGNPDAKKKGDYVLLETPFSAAAGPSVDNPQGDLGVFFKEVQSAPQIMECNRMTDGDLEVQLNSLGDQLSAYENKSAEYEDLLRMLEATAATSESESEAS